jgi:hypothetical protein
MAARGKCGRQSEQRHMLASGASQSAALIWAGLAIAVTCVVVSIAGRPLRRFFKLREEVHARLEYFAPLLGDARSAGEAMLAEAQQAFQDLGAKMSAFGRRRIATLRLRHMGFDPAYAASGLIGLANALPAYGIERLRWRVQVERALKLGEARMERSGVNALLLAVAVAAIAFAAWTYTTNWKLRHALRTAHIVRLSIEKEGMRTREQATDADAARRTAEQSLSGSRKRMVEVRRGRAAAERALAEVTAQLDLTRKAKVAAEQSLEQTKGELAAADTARKSAEDRLKAIDDELAALRTAKEEAQKSLKAANDELTALRTAKAESDAAAAKAKEDLEHERKAAEQTHAPPGTPAAAAP